MVFIKNDYFYKRYPYIELVTSVSHDFLESTLFGLSYTHKVVENFVEDVENGFVFDELNLIFFKGVENPVLFVKLSERKYYSDWAFKLNNLNEVLNGYSDWILRSDFQNLFVYLTEIKGFGFGLAIGVNIEKQMIDFFISKSVRGYSVIGYSMIYQIESDERKIVRNRLYIAPRQIGSFSKYPFSSPHSLPSGFDVENKPQKREPCLYLLYGSKSDTIKVGCSIDLDSRLKTYLNPGSSKNVMVSNQFRSNERVKLVWWMKSFDYKTEKDKYVLFEKKLIDYMDSRNDVYRTLLASEWFYITNPNLLKLIVRELDKVMKKVRRQIMNGKTNNFGF